MSAPGYRGYIFSRPTCGGRAPQHIQNLVIRDYAAKNGMLYKLSATEYAMPDSYLILHQVLEGLGGLQGIILYSIFLLPSDHAERRKIYRRVIEAGCGLHAAVEGMALEDWEDAERWEVVLLTAEICNKVNYHKIEQWLTQWLT